MREAIAVLDGEAGDHPFVVVDRVLLAGTSASSISFLARLIGAQDGRGAELARRGQVLLAQDLLHQLLLVVGVVDDEAAVDADGLAVAPEDPGTQRVERPGLDVAARLADEGDDPLAELGGGPVREGHREDLPRPDALDPDEVGDPMGQHPGLAGAGAGEDEDGSVGRLDRPRLLRVEVADDPLGEDRGRGRALGGARLGRRSGRGVGRRWRIDQVVGLDRHRCRLDDMGRREPVGISLVGRLGGHILGQRLGTPDPCGHGLILGCQAAPGVALRGFDPDTIVR